MRFPSELSALHRKSCAISTDIETAGLVEAVEQSADAIFNEEALLRRMMGDRQLAGIVLQAFLQEVPSLLHNLRRRLEEADTPGVHSQAHAFAGAAATAAAEGLHAIALAMERAGAAGQLDRCGELLPGAVEEFARYKSTLERHWLLAEASDDRS